MHKLLPPVEIQAEKHKLAIEEEALKKSVASLKLELNKTRQEINEAQLFKLKHIEMLEQEYTKKKESLQSEIQALAIERKKLMIPLNEMEKEILNKKRDLQLEELKIKEKTEEVSTLYTQYTELYLETGKTKDNLEQSIAHYEQKSLDYGNRLLMLREHERMLDEKWTEFHTTVAEKVTELDVKAGEIAKKELELRAKEMLLTAKEAKIKEKTAELVSRQQAFKLALQDKRLNNG